MSAWRIGLALVVLLLLQSSFIPLLGLPVARPDLLLLLTIYVGLSSRPEKATLTGFFAGIFQDSLSVGVAGLSSFAKSLIGFLTPNVQRSFMVTNFFVQLLAVAALTAAHALVLYWMGQALHPGSQESSTGELFAVSILPEISSNLIFWIFLKPGLRWTLPPPEHER